MTMGNKRAGDDISSLIVPFKRMKSNVREDFNSGNMAITKGRRTSSLLVPITRLQGHQGEVLCSKFHPEGQHLASSGSDQRIFIWNVYGECKNISVMRGHTDTITELHFCLKASHILYSASVDMTLGIWDIESSARVRKLQGHKAFVNSVNGAIKGLPHLCSGSDDGTAKVWDVRQKKECVTLNNKHQVTAVILNDINDQVITGSIDNHVKVWDSRKNAIMYEMRGHTNTITGLALSPAGSHILSNSMDGSLRIWDIRPFVTGERNVKIFNGHLHGYGTNLLRCAWSCDGKKVASGSGDGYHYIWDTITDKILYKLPSHNGSVNDIDFHQKEPIVCSGSSDQIVNIREIDS